MGYREYNPAEDKEAVCRVLREVGWLPPEEQKERYLALALECGRAMVADLNGAPECIVTTAMGEMRYLEHDIPLVEVTTVATSRIARRRGLAKRLLAQALAADRAEGAALARVCVFDQGFYNQVGFGPGSYEHTLHFDPATVNVEVRPRVPVRLSPDDAELIHASRLARRRGHGSVVYPASALTEIEARFWAESAFGLGYRDGPNGKLTHHFWCSVGRGEADHGPYHISWMTFQNRERFLELMALIKGLSDQVRLIRMREPAGMQLQDLLDRPFRHRSLTERSHFENRLAADAFWQVRMLDLGKCLAHTHLRWGETRFNLHLDDAIERLLEANVRWRGVGGDYVVTLGRESHAEPGSDSSLPTLTASVNAFTRLWLGVRPATGLAVTDELSGPEGLLEELDTVLRLPEPKPDWDF